MARHQRRLEGCLEEERGGVRAVKRDESDVEDAPRGDAEGEGRKGAAEGEGRKGGSDLISNRII